MERKTRVELATSSLARRRSTTELLPPEPPSTPAVGAEDETRTHTPFRAPPPQDGVSAYFTTSACGTAGRSGGVRTPDLRFWRPLLFQLSYTPALGRTSYQAIAPR